MNRAVKLLLNAAPSLLPFADAATPELPLGRLLRLALFQVSVGLALVLLNGTLNRVMIVELGIPAWLVATMVSLPILFAPARALIGFRSDNHRSVLGWRRVPYIWMGTLVQFGGLAILPFALLVLSGRGTDVVVFHVLDPHEIEFPFERATRFQDMESDHEVMAVPALVRQHYIEAMQALIERYRRELGGAGIDYQLLTTKDPLELALMQYLSTRERAF